MYSVHLKKSLAQHLLIDSNVAKKIVSCLSLEQGDNVLEIGPGEGALTRILLDKKTRILVLEKDKSLAQLLKSNWPEIDVLCIDALKVDWSRYNNFFASNLKVIGNLPYNVASALLWKIVSSLLFSKMVFTVQKDVALRIAANPGNRIYGALSAWIQNFARVKYEFEISENVFCPRPKVKSAVISLQSCLSSERPQNPKDLAEILHLCFQKRRKQLKKIFKDRWDKDLEQEFYKLGISPQHRPENLTPRNFVQLSKICKQ